MAHTITMTRTEGITQRLHTHIRSHVEVTSNRSYTESVREAPTTTNEVPVVVIRTVLAEDLRSHQVVKLGKLNLSRLLQEVGISVNELHSLDILSSSNVALINSFHLQLVRKKQS